MSTKGSTESELDIKSKPNSLYRISTHDWRDPYWTKLINKYIYLDIIFPYIRFYLCLQPKLLGTYVNKIQNSYYLQNIFVL